MVKKILTNSFSFFVQKKESSINPHVMIFNNKMALLNKQIITFEKSQGLCCFTKICLNDIGVKPSLCNLPLLRSHDPCCFTKMCMNHIGVQPLLKLTNQSATFSNYGNKTEATILSHFFHKSKVSTRFPQSLWLRCIFPYHPSYRYKLDLRA